MLSLAERGWRCLAILTAIIIGAAIGVSGCGDDDDGDGDGVTNPPRGFIITEEQAGRWQWVMTFEDDEGEPLAGFDDQTFNETLCPGIDYAQDHYEDCNVNVLSSTSFRVRCAETIDLPGVSCSITTILDLTFNFETASFTATGPVTLSTSISTFPPEGF